MENLLQVQRQKIKYRLDLSIQNFKTNEAVDLPIDKRVLTYDIKIVLKFYELISK